MYLSLAACLVTKTWGLGMVIRTELEQEATKKSTKVFSKPHKLRCVCQMVIHHIK